MKPRFSVIIPCRNGEATLPQCLAGLAGQQIGREAFEVIVVNNASSDNSVEITQRFGAKVLECPSGTIAQVRNVGATQAAGANFVFLDADCILPDDWLTLAETLLQPSDVGMVGAIENIPPKESGWVSTVWNLHLSRGANSDGALWFGSRALAVKADAFRAVGGFDSSLVTCEDVAFGHEISKRYRVIQNRSLAPIHLGEPTSLRQFFRKEARHGWDSLRTSLRYFGSPKELLGLLLPFYYLTMIALSISGMMLVIFGGSSQLLFIGLFGFLLPIVLLSIDTCRKIRNWSPLLRLHILYATYLVARTAALFGQQRCRE